MADEEKQEETVQQQEALAQRYARLGGEAVRKVEAAQTAMHAAGLSARARLAEEMREGVLLAQMYFTASMAHSNLTLMADENQIDVQF